MDNKDAQSEPDFPLFKFLSGGVKGMVESAVYFIIGVEKSAKKKK